SSGAGGSGRKDATPVHIQQRRARPTAIGCGGGDRIGFPCLTRFTGFHQSLCQRRFPFVLRVQR
ncbi:hypothetical protein S83_043542, partial [Arachis hypogaea]